MLFEDLGFRYIGPIDGHEPIDAQVPGDGPRPQRTDPAARGHGKGTRLQTRRRGSRLLPHSACVREDEGWRARKKASGEKPAYTNYAAMRFANQMRRKDSRVTVMTAAMCQGNKLEPVRDEFPDRFFDVGICESHAVAFAAGKPKRDASHRRYLQHLPAAIYDQIFQEVALQNLPVTLMIDRAGLTGPDGPTHHGCSISATCAFSPTSS
jgi:1-deoxy-D-xylulose-5-phosphate synthase